MNLTAMMFWLAVTTAGAAHTCDALGDVEVIANVACDCGLKPADGTALTCTGAGKFCAVSSSGYGICEAGAIAACATDSGAITAGNSGVVKVGGGGAGVDGACKCGDNAGLKVAFPGETCAIAAGTTVGTVTKKTCGGAGAEVTDEFGCDCGLNADGSILNCQKAEHCTISATGYGVCEAASAAVLANCETDSAAITTSGVVKAGRPCKCGSSPIAYALPTEQCTITTTAGSVLPACTVTDGSAVTGKACHCGTATCTASEFCKSATTSTCYPGIKKCQAKNLNKAFVETTDICACGNNADLCTPGEGCSVDAAGVGTCGTAVNQCAKTNGAAHTHASASDDCPCGTDVKITATGKGCDAVTTTAGEIKDTPATACADGDQKSISATGCACGVSAICTGSDLYCKSSTNTCSASSALTACGGNNGTFDEKDAECLCGTTKCGGSNADKFCDAGVCKNAKSTGTACTDAAAGDAGCLCGKKATCAKGKTCYGTATDDGVCYTAACTDDGWTKATAECLCGTALCAKDNFCLKGATAADYQCNTTATGTAYTAAKETAVKTAVDAKVCDNGGGGGGDGGDDEDDDSNNAACLGRFVTNMAVALNSI